MTADGTTVARRCLRAASFGRGIWACDLDSPPAVRLAIRSTTIDDGFRYFGGQAVSHDPRLNTPGAAAVPLDRTRAVDIRIDPPPYTFFGAVLDPVEFDEDLRSGTLVTGDRNLVYVQVQNRGAREVSGAVLHLYFAAATGTPPAAPALDADFWTRFPKEPAGGSAWARAGQVTVDHVRSDQPRIARFEWVPPTSLGADWRCWRWSAPRTTTSALPRRALPTAVHPDASGTTLTVVERRTALYIAPARRAVPDVLVRDGVGDSGEPGAIAWGGRGADIVVSPTPEADPDAAFGSIADVRADVRVRAGEDNLVYVRVFNRSAAAQTATVDLFFVPMAAVADSSTWQRIGAQQEVADIPARGHKFSPAFTWAAADIPDPAPSSAVKAHVLIALIGTGDDPAPDPSVVTSLGYG